VRGRAGPWPSPPGTRPNGPGDAGNRTCAPDAQQAGRHGGIDRVRAQARGAGRPGRPAPCPPTGSAAASRIIRCVPGGNSPRRSMYWSSIRLGRSPVSGSAKPAGQFGRAQVPVELEQGERIAAGLLDDPSGHALVERSRDGPWPAAPARDRPAALRLRAPAARPVRRRAGAPRTPSATDSAQQAAPDEAEDLSGGPVEPLRVVPPRTSAAVFSDVSAHQAERGQSDQEPVRVVARGQPETRRSAHAAAVRPANRAGRVSARTAGAGRRRPAPSPIRPRPARATVKPRGLADQVAQQLRLADPGFAPAAPGTALWAAAHVSRPAAARSPARRGLPSNEGCGPPGPAPSLPPVFFHRRRTLPAHANRGCGARRNGVNRHFRPDNGVIAQLFIWLRP